MQPAGGAMGRGRGPTVAPPPPPPPPPPPQGLSSSSASASPSSSSSAVSAPRSLGFESLQQQLALRQQQQQQLQQLRKPEQENRLNYKLGAMHGVIGGISFPSSSGVPASKLSRNLPNDHARQLHEKKLGRHALEQPQNPIHQAYTQSAMQAAQLQQKAHGNTPAQLGDFGMMGPAAGGQEILGGNLKMQEMHIKGGNQTQLLRFTNSADYTRCGEKQNEQDNICDGQNNDLKVPQIATGQFTPTNMIRPIQSLQSLGSLGNITNQQLMMAQLQAMQAWAMEHNVDLTHPANANLIAQFLPSLQSNRLAAIQKPNVSNSLAQQSNLSTLKPQIISSTVANENSAQGNSMIDLSGQAWLVRSGVGTNLSNSKNMHMQQPQPVQTSVTQNEKGDVVAAGSTGSVVHLQQGSTSTSQSFDLSNGKKSAATNLSQMQSFKKSQNIRHPTPPAPMSSEVTGIHVPTGGGSEQAVRQHVGFTNQQLLVLKAQIFAFRRLKRGENALPPDLLQSIVPPPLGLHPQVALLSPKMSKQENFMGQDVGEHVMHPENNHISQPATPKDHSLPKKLPVGKEKAPMVTPLLVEAVVPKENAGEITTGKVPQIYPVSVKSEQDVDHDSSFKGESDAEKGKSVPSSSSSVDFGQEKKTSTANVCVPSNAEKYHGPLFDLPFYTRTYEALGLTTTINSNNFTLSNSNDITELLYEEGKEALKKKRTFYLKKLSNILAFNLGRKTIKPDLVLRLQIEEKKLHLLDFQTRLRDEVDEQQQEIMAMPDRSYRKFVRQCERHRLELIRQVLQLQKVTKEKQLKSIFQWRKKLLETHWSIRDARTTLNRGVAKYHERMLREFSKRKDDDRCKRLEALKKNDVNRYREMLLEQQTSIPGDAAHRYAVLSSFLSQTEEYLHKLGTKITTSKKQQGIEEAANVAAAAARSQGLSEEEVKAAAACAREEVMIRNTFLEINAPRDGSSVNKYYNLAHAVNEKVIRQPSMLRAGTLRDYQLTGLQWMLSLYNNKLNGILADEMGLGKTVQVMALIAYLMEFKANYGPHLIIVPNAVLVNWKSELHNWLPSVSCIFYVGSKDERSRLFSHVCSLKFNVLVTTYEFIMYDRSKLSRIDWKYIVIDEAQRMKNRESVLARDLDRYRCQRRLLLTGTPLQNDLKELWSLLNLLLPEVFDNQKAFHDWFSKPFQKDGPSHNQEDDWLETEKKVIVIHRLHQILEPFMLRRRVEDVEGSLPPKVSVVLRCRMSDLQGAIYDWIKSTGTIRVNPDDESRKAERNPNYQIKMYKNLNNKCMELRKACNHPLLNYPYFNDYSKEFLVRSCGKLWILDRILLKLHKAGHRVLLFSTMTKLLDILEEYLQWRQLVYRRIDGTTSLEDRESAINDFNSPVSESFIFLLSIRAAGRGLNLQTADTVIIYDPDPNPQNEEQAIARAHRIGQKREVKVIYMEAVVDKISSYQKEDDIRNGGSGDSEDDLLVGKHRYVGSIESLIRNNIQQYKIDMADEVINAGRFDQRTTHEERRMTLETLLHDEERYQETVHDVPSPLEVNRLIARSEEEVGLFDRMDEELDWTGEMTKHNQVPMWLRADSKEVNAYTARLYKRPSKNILGSVVDLESSEVIPGLSLNKAERKSGRPKGLIAQNYSSYAEFDDEYGEDSDASSEEGNVYSSREEDREIRYIDDDDLSGTAADLQGNFKYPLEEEGLVCNGGYEFSDAIEENTRARMCEEAGSTGSSSGNKRTQQLMTPSLSLRKFGFLSELDARPGVLSTKLNDLEEGEIAVSRDSHVEIQQSGGWNHDQDDGEDEQVIQPKLKRKRSKRFHSKHTVERLEEKSSSYRTFSQHDKGMFSRMDGGIGEFNDPFFIRHGISPSSLKQRSYLPTQRAPAININKQKFRGSSSLIGCEEDALDHSRGSWNGQANHNTGPGLIKRKMSGSMQRKCKNVICKLQRRIDKEGCQLIPMLYDLWKKNDFSNSTSKISRTSNPFNLWVIDQRVEGLEYAEVADFIADVQSMLKTVVQFYKHSQQVKYEARKLHDMFFHIMKIAFPDSDFREAKMALTFSSPGQGGTVAKHSMRPCIINHSKPHKMVREDVDTIPLRSASRTPIFKSNPLPSVDGCGRANSSRFVKDKKPSNGRILEQNLADRSRLGPLLTHSHPHPGELVICKKKRKDRDKSSVRPKMRPVSPADANQAVSSPARQMAGRGGYVAGASSMAVLQWARPVKRMRTDTGRRRPLHL